MHIYRCGAVAYECWDQGARVCSQSVMCCSHCTELLMEYGDLFDSIEHLHQ